MLRFIIMHEYKDEDGKLVREYTFEDFESGLISGKMDVGKHKVINTTTNETWFDFMTYENYELILKYRIELYNAKAEKHFKILKDNFGKELEKSSDKNRLIDAEINFCEFAFYPDKRATVYVPQNEQQDYSDLYHTIIVRGKKDYNSTNSPSCHVQIGGGDNQYIRVEALAKYYNWLKQIKDKSISEIQRNVKVTTKTKLDFTKEKLKPLILEFARLNGYEKPSTYLNELLNEVKQFQDFEFEGNFFLNVHYLCKENSTSFWSESHRKDISNWLRKAHIITDVFKTTWENISPTQTEKPIIEKRIFSTDLAGIKPTNISSKYNSLYTRWKFNNSDEIWIDGKLIPPKEKSLIIMSSYNIIPKPNDIIISETKDGFALEELDFIEQELKEKQPLYKKTIGSKINDTQHKQIKIYLEYLEKRKRELTKNKSTKESKNDFTHKQIAIAYCLLGKLITSENVAEILQKHSTNKSTEKLLQKRIHKASDLIRISDHKTTNTLHLKDLEAAKRLLSGMKKKKAIHDLDQIITTFKSNILNNH